MEAERCIQCPAAPCIKACPVDNDIPGALWKLENGDVLGAAEVFYETSNLPEMCGRFCPQESLCEGSCVIGKNAAPVAIGRLEAFVADEYRTSGGYDVETAPVLSGQRVSVAEHFRRWTEAGAESGQRQVEEIERANRIARDLLVRLTERIDEAGQEQPL